MAQSLMIQGTGSGVGKSLLVTALCRIFKDMGIDVAPFKAQNMALNAYVTKEGGEIGVAQALQARAARIEPEIDMNPILLKPSGEAGVQIVIHGKVHSIMQAKGYYGFKNYALEAVRSSFQRLSKSHELIIIEGAGSPAEINLMKNDIVNMAMAKYANAPVLLVGDIDKGGVFASFYGTIKLLCRDSRYIKAFIINKFRGDLGLLKPGLKMIKTKTGRPVIGVIPYVRDLYLPEEDGTSIKEIYAGARTHRTFQTKGQGNPAPTKFISNMGVHVAEHKPRAYEKFEIQDSIKIVVVKLLYISNFTDFEPFYYEPDVELIYSNNPSDISQADIVIIPGTKNTMDDLTFLKRTGLTESIKKAYKKDIQIIGICGGYQMLGKRLLNPYSVEGRIKTLDGIGMLNIKTVFQKEKITSQVEVKIVQGSALGIKGLEDTGLKGYEIHHGVSKGDIGLFRLKRVSGENTKSMGGFDTPDGSKNKNCFGTYIHGIFDNDKFRRVILNSIRTKKGLKPLKHIYSYTKTQDETIDRFTDTVKMHLDMEFIKSLIRV
ncbi:MAG: cobyric acid synthase [Deltaproteobacteria bacterium]|nr:cobyric acid synthase [Deltaproteobacteria bacterium]MCL5793088.1 cobyric acid synthase [Deltaproteobacteria bacterium]